MKSATHATSLFTAIPLSLLLLAGCSSTTQQEEQLNNPDWVMEKVEEAYKKKEYERAFHLLFPVAVAGDARAQYTLGYLYHHGFGVEKDDQQAMQWIQRAASQGHAKAIKALKNR
ncbi:tetratricopeptide repeat protein [endosymbiont of Ridgeia piscesae]|jgi:TPR repeat protein|uniref:Sel1 repeat n=1 Tax=endosymbiont of Ridgeia piscesae TaxID=54398 RepID=A0A0T5YYZ9_9GAMM|nr:tetratricopeptide repeat protein [endosymbiont of Ridgeia piscesae]KRT55772.1 Sel1 repeat [endosymbiont of Ridgeia piscesae]KRT58995.1 Sel1 repeat-containing protein [endosymbiont of Ridgeia piscesae]